MDYFEEVEIFQCANQEFLMMFSMMYHAFNIGLAMDLTRSMKKPYGSKFNKNYSFLIWLVLILGYFIFY